MLTGIIDPDFVITNEKGLKLLFVESDTFLEVHL